MNNFNLFSFSALILLQSALVFGRNGFPDAAVVINDVQPEDFLIMPWGWTPADERAIADIKECGFNVAGFLLPEHVELARKVQIKCFVDDPRISGHVLDESLNEKEIAARVNESIAKFKDDPIVFGWYLKDEPIAPQFTSLARWYNAVRKADPDATAYINLLPIGAQGPGSKDYQDYIEQYVKVIEPSYISYDHYTLRDDGSVSPTLYLNLSVMRKASLRHSIPFWNIILANSHFRYASPTQGSLNLQAYATLAYGGRGICYFTYFAPQVGNYREAAVDQFLNKTPTWDMLRFLNLQIRQLCPTYLKLKSVNVFHHPQVPEGENAISESIHLSELSGGNFLVGEFVDPDGIPFVLIVNKDIRFSTGFQAKFKKEGDIMQTNAYTGLTAPWGGANNWLAPGAGMLLSLQK